MPTQTLAQTRPAKRRQPERSTDLPPELAVPDLPEVDRSGNKPTPPPAASPDQADHADTPTPLDVIDPAKRYTTARLAELLGLRPGEIVAGIQQAQQADNIYVETYGGSLGGPHVEISGRTVRRWLLTAKPRCNLPPGATPARPAAAKPAPPTPPPVPEPRDAGERLTHTLNAMAARDEAEVDAVRREAWAALLPLLEKSAQRTDRDTAELAEIAAELGLDTARLAAIQNAVVDIARHRATVSCTDEHSAAVRSCRAAVRETNRRHKGELAEVARAARRAESQLYAAKEAAGKLATLQQRFPEIFEFGSTGQAD